MLLVLLPLLVFQGRRVALANGDDGEAVFEKLKAASTQVWPGMLKALKATKLDSTEVLKDTAGWKGKVVWYDGDQPSGGAYESHYDVLVEIDGVPVCGDVDSELTRSYKDWFDKLVRRDMVFTEWAKKKDPPYGDKVFKGPQQYAAVVVGGCKVWETSHNQRTQLDGVKVRIVGHKTKMFAGACGQGTNLRAAEELAGVATSDADHAGDAAKDPGSEASAPTGAEADAATGAASGGAMPWVHRIVAWGLSLLLVLGGMLALVHGVSKFVPQLQEQKVKLGDYLGYAGIALAAIGCLWFGAALVLPLVLKESRFGSLPSIALVLAGAFVGLDLLRAKGKLKAETASLIQPLAILLGLACFPAALAHVIFWDRMFL
jgi:hypothetical protein